MTDVSDDVVRLLFPETLTFNASSNNITQSFTEETPSIPGVSSNGILVGNIGLGFSF